MVYWYLVIGFGWVVHLWPTRCILVEVVVVVICVINLNVVIIISIVFLLLYFVAFVGDVMLVVSLLLVILMLLSIYSRGLWVSLECQWECVYVVLGCLVSLVLGCCVRVLGLLLYVLVLVWEGQVMVGCCLVGNRWWSLWQGALLVFWTCAEESM